MIRHIIATNADVSDNMRSPYSAEPPDEKALATARMTYTTISSTVAKVIV
jgi:hypothetical protein